MRADSAFYGADVVNSCRALGARFSITVRTNASVKAAVARIDEDAWTPIPYFCDGADVAETSYRPFGPNGKLCRLIVRRVKSTPGSQLALLATYAYRPFFTDRDGDTVELETDTAATPRWRTPSGT